MAIVPADANGARAQAPAQRVVQAEPVQEDQGEQSLRPNTLNEYLGQEELKQSLGVTLAAARQRGEPIDHLLFYGPPGLGKTTISMLIAAEMQTQIRITSAPALERPRDIAGLLLSLQAGDILFIDEIHRLNRVTEEMLYPAMEDFMLDITIGKGQAARIKRLPLKRFTLIGATTRAGAISAPLRARFGLVHRLRFYTDTEMQKILLQSAGLLKIPLTEAGALAIGSRSRGTPRVGNRLLKRVRDFAQVKGKLEIDENIAVEALDLLQVDRFGLDPTDRLLLKTIIRNYQGGPVGIDTLAAAISEDGSTIEEVYEPFLMQAGFLQRTQRGRMVTPQAYQHLGFDLPGGQLPLFEA
ncbi:Holliday junction branch migration DNA helicase RuvB [bacterium (Candidatus Blackallbacteria) CG17_big_fil_post_rev_8_21_14_2_50_48_46]|uniref:Holliday junction branch migration complex subunit RuvB n=1 Tax=bacterium (Candidatus Blackallbacteria) CG17_big_fil_post_rev_8_21_14_2_50_48_46 TaxID=2014261 RepID=A0A2M7GBC8_9BACT|nr:MAG: Holliday junction branch migration DNA helicase RuvB [bacterium (Candidatus Blackallbacteria) CG18_big_fil_WC_8_21_14_2_50_49_26]PIW19440.1 MAG: Holliday junction branch migration DNA helicase RuvB [bacterium (Candidatus Blackallbacteria) CG17_big_fil_post_rev_8_21_14_2_50_48_46]PIW48956.1 MAG: Holliday junction branch migration DNA helicase RuvB [bacterium (Candidatus Blackallbacteria) CG13_big_fil_rev_8_21_14_2_50_49_14]